MNMPPAAAQAQRLREQAIEHIRANRTQAAEEALQALVRLQPQDVPACLELAGLMAGHGRFRASSAPLLVAMQHLPRHAPLLLKLAGELMARGEVMAARSCLDFLSRAPDPPADVLAQQARLRYGLGEIERAQDLFGRALDAGADAAEDHLLHAVLLEFTGHADAARQVLEMCLSRWPGYGDAIVALTRMCKQTPQDNQLAHVDGQLRALSGSYGSRSQRIHRAAFEHARFKILDDLGQHADAWPSLARSNAIMHDLHPYNGQAEQALTEALVGQPALQGGGPHAGRVGDGPIPIFIVGLPRSGTTLLDRMLSSHSQVSSAGELHDFELQLHWTADHRPGGVGGLLRIVEQAGRIDFGTLGRRYLEQTQWRAQGRGYYIDKLPANIRLAAFIRRALPQARILNMVRDPMDVCFSNFKLFGNTSPYIHDLATISDFHRQHVRLCAHWHLTAPGMMLDVAYEDLVRHPHASMQRVLNYCGLGIEPACLAPERNAAPVATPSSSQVREPIHTRGIGQWRRYASQLEPLRRALDRTRD